MPAQSHIRRQRTVRLMILLAVIVAMILGVLGLYSYRQIQQSSRISGARQQAIDATANGNYRQAIRHWLTYLQHDSQDAEAYYQLAQARLAVPMPGGEHRVRAMRHLQHAVENDPKRLDAQRQLMELSKELVAYDIALECARAILEQEPNDIEAITTQAVALGRLGHDDKAIKAASAALEQHPTLLQLWLLKFELTYKQTQNSDELIEQAAALRKTYPDDPRFELLQAFAFGLADEPDVAKQWLRTASNADPPDDEFVITLVRFLSQADLYREAMQVLEQAASADGKGAIYQEWIMRLFEAGRFRQVLESLATADLAKREPSRAVPLLVVGALAGLQTNQLEPVLQTIEQLSQISDDLASTWVPLLRALVDGSITPADRIAKAEAAARSRPDQPYLFALLATELGAAGRGQQAAWAWRRVSSLRPTWHLPFDVRARKALDEGRFQAAYELASQALLRQPQDRRLAVLLVRCRLASLDRINPTAAGHLASYIDRLEQANVPGAALALLRAQLAFKSDNAAAARRLIQQRLRSDPPPQTAWLEQAYALAGDHDPQLSDQLEQQIASRADASTQFVLTQALADVRRGEYDKARARFSSRGFNPATSDDAIMLAGYATLLDALDQPAQARELWVKAATLPRANAFVINQALASESVRSDPQSNSTLTELARKVIGSESPAVRISTIRAQAQQATDQPQRDALIAQTRELVKRYPSNVQARLLLANLHQQSGDLASALAELESAVGSISHAPRLLLAAATIQAQIGDATLASRHINQLLQLPNVDDQLVESAGTLLASISQMKQARQVLLDIEKRTGALSTQSRMTLATVCNRLADTSTFEKQITQLQRASDPAGVVFAARMLAPQDPERARAALDRIDQLGLPAARVAWHRSSYLLAMGEPDKAIDLLAKHTANDVDCALRATAIALSQGMIDIALHIAKQHETNPAMKRLLDVSNEVQTLAIAGVLRPLFAAIVEPDSTTIGQTQTGPVAAQVVNALAAVDDKPVVGDHGKLRRPYAVRLVELAQEHEQSLALTMLAVQALASQGETQQALALASQAMNRFPEPGPAELVTHLALQLGQYDTASVAAQAWRQRQSNDPLRPAVALAQAQLGLKQYNLALETIKPILQSNKLDPSARHELEMMQVRVLVHLKQTDKATAIVRQRLTTKPFDPRWRGLVFDLVSSTIEPIAVANQWVDLARQAPGADEHGVQRALAQALALAGRRLGDKKAIAAALDQIRQLTDQPNADNRSWLVRGMIAQMAGQGNDAIESYQRSIELGPVIPAAANNLAMLLLETGKDPARAIELAGAAIKRAPNAPGYHDTLARACAVAGQNEKALAAIDKAVALSPNNPQYLHARLLLLTKLDRIEQAEELRTDLLRRFGELDIDWP